MFVFGTGHLQCEEKYGIVEIIETEGILYTADTACVWCYLEIFSEWKGYMYAVYKKAFKRTALSNGA